MLYPNQSAKINVKLLIILILVAAAVGISLVLARQTRRGMLSERSLAEGEAAFATKDWPAAVKSYRKYLSGNPDDVGILRKYAESCLAVRPLDASVVAGAISAYRRIIQLVPRDEVAYEKLAMLYGVVGNFEELASIARLRLEGDPNDLKAPLWLAEALGRLNKPAEARQTLATFIDKLDTLPDKHVEYVRACVQMSQLAAGEVSPQPQTMADDANSPNPPTPLDWLNKAVHYSPDSVEALVCRAEFRRQTAGAADTNEPDRSVFLALARQDLEAADAKSTDDPRIRFLLAAEWIAHGELDRAADDMKAADELPHERLQERFLDINDWKVARFLLASELATKKGTAAEAASLAQEVLKSLTEKRHRVQVLPSAIPLYVAAGRVVEARQSLEEYLGLLPAQEVSAESARRVAALQALVAGAENRPYAVIDALEPAIGNDSSDSGLWRLLVEAYDRTGQTGRAVKALAQYRRLNPQDPQAMRELARQYWKLGDRAKAFDTASIAESLGDSDLAVKLIRIGAGINLAVGQHDSVSVEEIKKLSAELADLRQGYPDIVGVRILQAVVADSLGRPDDAEKELKLAIEQCKEPLRAEIQLAGLYHRTKRTNQAISVCETACKNHSEAALPWLALSDLHAANANYDSARNCLKQGLNTVAEGREKRSLSTKLALLELVHGNRSMGTDLLREVAAQDKQEIQARLLLLGIREIQEDQAVVEKLVGELRQAEGESGLWWRLHQASLGLSSDNWSAKQQDITNLLQYCINADPVWSAPVLLLAQMYERLGDLRRLEDTCRQGLLQNPSATDIADRLMAFLDRQGRFSDAEKLLRQLKIDPRVASAWQVRVALGARDFSRAIDELKVRVSNNNQDASSRVQLARLVYQETKDAGQALKYLKEAEVITPDSRTLIAVRASILKAEGKSAEALQVLNGYVADHNDFNAYWMRAAYLVEEGALESAEQDYRKLTTFTQNAATGYELLSNFYAGTQRIDQAVATLEQGLSMYPEDLRLMRALMRLLLQRAGARDREKALTVLAALEEKLPHDAELLTIRALQMLEESTATQSPSVAKEKLEKAVKLEPTAVRAHLALIGIAMRQRQYKAACDYAVRALDSNPDNPVLLSARARAELASGYTQMAVKLARRALQEDPNNKEALSVLADGALGSRDRTLLEETRTLIESAVGREPLNDRLLIARSHVLAAMELPKLAIPELEAFCQTKEGAGSIRALVTLADLYRLTGDVDRAGQWIRHAQRLDPNDQAVVHARFLWLVSQNRFEELSQISSAYLSAKDQDPTVVLTAASILSGSDSMTLKKEGLKLFEHAVALSSTSIDARLGLASLSYKTGDAERAENIYRQLLEQHPGEIRALNDLAWILQEHYQRYADALELSDRGLKLASKDVHLLDTRGTILSNMPDRLADAKSDFEMLLQELAPSNTRQQAATLLKLGRICAKLNDGDQAKQHLDRALEIDRKMNVLTVDERSEIAGIMNLSTLPGPK